jgi:hypothetical protein
MAPKTTAKTAVKDGRRPRKNKNKNNDDDDDNSVSTDSSSDENVGTAPPPNSAAPPRPLSIAKQKKAQKEALKAAAAANNMNLSVNHHRLPEAAPAEAGHLVAAKINAMPADDDEDDTALFKNYTAAKFHDSCWSVYRLDADIVDGPMTGNAQRQHNENLRTCIGDLRRVWRPGHPKYVIALSSAIKNAAGVMMDIPITQVIIGVAGITVANTPSLRTKINKHLNNIKDEKNSKSNNSNNTSVMSSPAQFASPQCALPPPLSGRGNHFHRPSNTDPRDIMISWRLLPGAIIECGMPFATLERLLRYCVANKQSVPSRRVLRAQVKNIVELRFARLKEKLKENRATTKYVTLMFDGGVINALGTHVVMILVQMGKWTFPLPPVILDSSPSGKILGDALNKSLDEFGLRHGFDVTHAVADGASVNVKALQSCGWFRQTLGLGAVGDTIDAPDAPISTVDADIDDDAPPEMITEKHDLKVREIVLDYMKVHPGAHRLHCNAHKFMLRVKGALTVAKWSDTGASTFIKNLDRLIGFAQEARRENLRRFIRDVTQARAAAAKSRNVMGAIFERISANPSKTRFCDILVAPDYSPQFVNAMSSRWSTTAAFQDQSFKDYKGLQTEIETLYAQNRGGETIVTPLARGNATRWHTSVFRAIVFAIHHFYDIIEFIRKNRQTFKNSKPGVPLLAFCDSEADAIAAVHEELKQYRDALHAVAAALERIDDFPVITEAQPRAHVWRSELRSIKDFYARQVVSYPPNVAAYNIGQRIVLGMSQELTKLWDDEERSKPPNYWCWFLYPPNMRGHLLDDANAGENFAMTQPTALAAKLGHVRADPGEWDAYKGECRSDPRVASISILTVVAWWNDNRSKFPTLAGFAVHALHVPLVVTGCDQMLSMARRVLPETRGKLEKTFATKMLVARLLTQDPQEVRLLDLVDEFDVDCDAEEEDDDEQDNADTANG